MVTKTVRRSIAMTPEMRNLLAQLVALQGHEITEAELIRDAIRLYLDEQADLVGSRRHFQKSLQARLDQFEATLSFQLQILIFLLSAALADDGSIAIEEAIVAAKRDGEALLAQIAAVRELRIDS